MLRVHSRLLGVVRHVVVLAQRLFVIEQSLGGMALGLIAVRIGRKCLLALPFPVVPHGRHERRDGVACREGFFQRLVVVVLLLALLGASCEPDADAGAL